MRHPEHNGFFQEGCRQWRSDTGMKYGDVVPVTPDAPDRVAAVGRLQLPHLTCLRWQRGENLRVEAQHGPLRDTALETAQGYRRVNDGPWVRVVLEQGNVRSHPVMMASPRASPGYKSLDHHGTGNSGWSSWLRRQLSYGGVTVDALRTILGDEWLLSKRPELISDGVPSGAVTQLMWRCPNWEPTIIAATAHLATVTLHRPS